MDIKPGDRVSIAETHQVFAGHTGEVLEVDLEARRATVHVAELGHVREGVGVYGLVVPLEDLSPLPEEGATPTVLQ